MSDNPKDWLGLELDGGRYRVTDRLGEGGMGFVYKAHARNLDCHVVIKVPRRAMLDEPQFVSRFQREIRSLVNLTHPHIVKIIDVGRHREIPFAVMQYLSGGSLEDRLGQGGKELDSWLGDVAGALDYIHAENFVHRDVKPANILFDRQGHAYLSDFGIAKAIADSEAAAQTSGLTGTGMVLGTADYMAPEVVMDATFDGRADQYSLAVTLYELLSGRQPFSAATPAAVLVEKATKPAPSLRSISPHLPESLCAAVDRALSKDPRQRFASCGDFIAAALSETSAGEKGTGPVTEQHPPDRTGSLAASPLPQSPVSQSPVSHSPQSHSSPESAPYKLDLSPLPLSAKDTDPQAAAGTGSLTDPPLVEAVLVECSTPHKTRQRGPGCWLIVAVALALPAVPLLVALVMYNLVNPGVGDNGGQFTDPWMTESDPTNGQDRPADHDHDYDDWGDVTDDTAADDDSHGPDPPKTDDPKGDDAADDAPTVDAPPCADDTATDTADKPADDDTGPRGDDVGPRDSAPPDRPVPPALVAPFDEDAALRAQRQWAAYLGKPSPIETNSIGMKLVLIPPGEFLMGTENNSYEQQHRVRITRPAYVGLYEVTQSEYERVMGDNPSEFSQTGAFKDRVAGLDTSRFPVEDVSWQEAVEFCRKLSALPEERFAGRKYRLPSEAQWEYVCRAGTTTPCYFGSSCNGHRANCNGTAPYGTTVNGPSLKRTSRVGSYPPNAFGLYDMHGNLWEWCADWYDPNRDYYGQSPLDDPPGPLSGSDRILRGGSWTHSSQDVRSAYRYQYRPDYGTSMFGLRVVRTAATP